MKKSSLCVMLLFLFAGGAFAGEAVSLAGTWRFRLDPKAEGLPAGWFNQKLPDPIELPGSCEQRGYGEKPGQPDPGRLTHVLTYVGPAWYQRDLVIPPQWTGNRAELFLERCHWETTVWVDGQRIGMQNSLAESANPGNVNHLAKVPVGDEDQMMRGFHAPSRDCYPAVYGFMPVERGGGIPDANMIRDLQELKAKGVTSVLLYFPGGVDYVEGGGQKLVFGETENRIEATEEYSGPGAIKEPIPPSPVWWSAEWRRMLRLAAKEGARLGLEVGITAGAGGCEIRGLPIPDEYYQQFLVFSNVSIQGPKEISQRLPLGKDVLLGEKDGLPRYYRDIAVLAIPAGGQVDPSRILDVTGKMAADGELKWQAPEGGWEIFRFGYSMQVSGGWGGAFIDHLNPKALDAKWDVTLGLLLKEMTPEERKGLTYVECDSFEGWGQSWTANFPDEFLKRRGYDIRPWLPVLAGRTIGDNARSTRFKRDYQLTISDLFADNHYARHTELARAAGLKFYAEAAGPHQHQTDLLKSLSRCDVPMGEFWTPGNHRGVGDDLRFLLRDAAAAAHGYGMKEVFCEAFTGGQDAWSVPPFRMKPVGDQAFCDGLTRPCIHGCTMTFWPDGKPGLSYWGVEFNRNVTWWEQAGAFTLYLARNSHMLKQGLFAADVAYFTGEGIGQGMPRKSSYAELGEMYDYDRVNTEILLSRMEFKNGRIELPDGMSYRLLVLKEKEPLSIAALRKLLSLVEAGATVVGRRPTEPYGLQDDPAEFASLADQLWSKGETGPEGSRTVGKGRVVWGRPVLQVLKEESVLPDFECRGLSTKGKIDWIHRHTDEGEIYLVCSRWEPVEQIECVFRVEGKVPELWDPVTGQIREAGSYRQADGRTIVPLRMDPCGSVFVVFRKPTTEMQRSGKNWSEYQSVQEVAGPWQVDFDPAWFYPVPSGMTNTTVMFNSLVDWATRPEAAVKYYSGRATYRKEFDISAKIGSRMLAASHTNQEAVTTNQERLFIDLGDVREVAAVRLNGKDLGVLWAKPFRVEVTGIIKVGANRLEIDVANLWPNRLTGDAFQPKGERRTHTNVIKYTQNTQCVSSGLLGPVKVTKVE